MIDSNSSRIDEPVFVERLVWLFGWFPVGVDECATTPRWWLDWLFDRATEGLFDDCLYSPCFFSSSSDGLLVWRDVLMLSWSIDWSIDSRAWWSHAQISSLTTVARVSWPVWHLIAQDSQQGFGLIVWSHVKQINIACWIGWLLCNAVQPVLIVPKIDWLPHNSVEVVGE